MACKSIIAMREKMVVSAASRAGIHLTRTHNWSSEEEHALLPINPDANVVTWGGGVDNPGRGTGVMTS